jgi:uncharacterized protein (TIGR03067 family)
MRWTGLTALVLALFVVTDLSAVADRPEKKKKVDPVEKEIKKLQGTWRFTNFEFSGRQYGAEIGAKLGNPRLVIKGKKLTVQSRGQTTTINLKVNPKKQPKELDAVPLLFGGRGASPGIYVLEGNTLKICLPRLGNQRPANFNTQNGNGNRNYVITWQRIKS